jgi:hypothetical protein
MTISRAQTAKTVTKAPSSRRRKRNTGTGKSGENINIPQKYLAGLSPAQKAKRKKEILKNRKKDPSDPSAYNFSTDKTASGTRRKTKESKHTKAFRNRFG